LYGSSFHDVDSNEMAFKITGSMAMKKGREAGAAWKAIMKVKRLCAEDYMGDVVEVI